MMNAIFNAMNLVTYTGVAIMAAATLVGLNSAEKKFAKGIKWYSVRFVVAVLCVVIGNEVGGNTSILLVTMVQAPSAAISEHALGVSAIGTAVVLFNFLMGWGLGFGLGLLKLKYQPAPVAPTKKGLEL
jgi:hypothetical protein